MYETPGVSNVKHAGVRDILMSTYWYDELPFLTGEWRLHTVELQDLQIVASLRITNARVM